jgi:peptidyl-prolyl cis-trans isomerase C
MPLLREGPDSGPHFNYHLLRNALEEFSRNPAALDAQQYRRVLDRATRSYRLESRVLAAPEARGLLIPEAQLNAAVAEVASRYADDEELAADLAANGLDPLVLKRALWRELMFDAVMQRVGSKAADVNEIDLRLFYEMHRDRFETPERRTARHILISINADFADNTRAAARARVERLAGHLKGRRQRFQDLARRHSECPTAMEGGLLGELKRGVLYPELDAVLFGMGEGEVSGIVESEMGFHILACEKIESARQIPFAVAAEKIRDILQQRRRRNCQKAWLATLDDTQR